MVIGIPENWHFVLASRSPRRNQLLKELGLDFTVIVKEFNEEFPPDLTGSEIAEFLAYNKAMQFKSEIKKGEIVITADTIVWCSSRVMDKPVDDSDAEDILRSLSGKTHEVITGVTFLSSDNDHTFSETTVVEFDDLSDEEIKHYVREFHPFDKAGAYGIQEWIGLVGIKSISGSYFNVMGLPVQKLYKELIQYIKNNDKF